MPRIVNWDLVANPLNWITVFLMLTIAGIAIHIIATQSMGD